MAMYIPGCPTSIKTKATARKDVAPAGSLIYYW